MRIPKPVKFLSYGGNTITLCKRGDEIVNSFLHTGSIAEQSEVASIKPKVIIRYLGFPSIKKYVQHRIQLLRSKNDFYDEEFFKRLNEIMRGKGRKPSNVELEAMKLYAKITGKYSDTNINVETITLTTQSGKSFDGISSEHRTPRIAMENNQ